MSSMSCETVSITPAEELLRLLLTEDKLPDDYTCYMEKTESFTTVYAVTRLVLNNIVATDPQLATRVRRCIPM